LVVVSRKQIEKKIGKLDKDQYVKVSKGQVPVVVQFDDFNGDGIWDEMVFQTDLDRWEKISMGIAIDSLQPPLQRGKTYARHRRKNTDNSFGEDLKRDSIPAGQKGVDFSKVSLPDFLTEGPAWENDKVGFRIYFDTRNAKDIWGKIAPRLILDTVGVNPAENYHQESDWGMDILKVGASLGAGGLAIKFHHHGRDTIVRLGGDAMGKVLYEKVADGPVRSVIRLHYPSWIIGAGYRPVSLTEEISIWSGQYYYQSTVTIKNAPENASLVVGFVNLKGKKLHQRKDRKARYIYSYGRQSENNDNLGLAITLPEKTNYFVGTTPDVDTDVQSTHYVSIPLKSSDTKSFRFLTGWEKSSVAFSEEKGFNDYVSRISRQYLKPLKIK